MIRSGFTMIDPLSGTRTVVLRGAEETGGRGWTLEVHCPEDAGPAIPEHLHLMWTETFEIVRGSASYKLDGRRRTAVAGDTIRMPAGRPHLHPWNAGTGDLVFRQTTDFATESPDAVDDVLGAFATINGLAREGRIGANGLPRNPLQFAATLRTLTKHGGFDAKVPIAVQRALGATLGRLAEAVGYRGVYSRYLT